MLKNLTTTGKKKKKPIVRKLLETLVPGYKKLKRFTDR